MKVRDLVEFLNTCDPEQEVTLWHWETQLGGGRERYLTPTLSAGDGGRVTLMPNGVVPGTGPEDQPYLLVEMSGNYDIVSVTSMNPWEADIANAEIMRYGDKLILPERYAAETGRPLPDDWEDY